MTKQEKAMELHNKGYNCAQAVACSFCEELGLEESVVFAACEGFGLGMGAMQATCGAVSGAVMVSGFKNSCKDLEQPNSKGKTYQLSKEIVAQFVEKNSTIVCKELKGVETGKMLRSCKDCIADAVEIAEKVLAL